jgi:hypothetical protein
VAYKNSLVRLVLFVYRHARTPIPGVPAAPADAAAVLRDLPDNPTPDDVRTLLLALSAPHAVPPTPRPDDLVQWFVRLASCSTLSSFDVRVPSKLAVHLVYAFRFESTSGSLINHL